MSAAPDAARSVELAPGTHLRRHFGGVGARFWPVFAPFVFDRPINGERFRLYLENELVPTLKPGDIVIMDNLSSHKGDAIRTVIRAVGARLPFLPPYSPDLNPIEQVFSKIKPLMRKAAERSVEKTWRRPGALLRRFSPAECSRYFVNSGYNAS
jgi:transposase